MIKECKVLLRNPDVMVVDYDGTKVQFKSDNDVIRKVYVEYKNGKYSLCTENDFKKSINKQTKKTVEKKLLEEAAGGEENNVSK